MMRRRVGMSRWVILCGFMAGIGLGASPGCAGKKKQTQTPEECMRHCEQERCDNGPNSTGSDEHFECLEVCADECN